MRLFRFGLKGMMVAALAAIALTAAPRAEATTLSFVLSGDYNASWTLDTNPTPSGISTSDGYTYFSGVAGVTPLQLVFYSSTLGFASGGIRISTTPDPLTEVGSIFDLGGDQIYSGTEAAPVFAPGLFTLNQDFITNVALLSPTTLKVSLVTVGTAPIPATLPLLVTALTGLGYAGWRRRRSADRT